MLSVRADYVLSSLQIVIHIPDWQEYVSYMRIAYLTDRYLDPSRIGSRGRLTKGSTLGKMPASPTIWNLDILSPREQGLVYRRQLDRPEVTRRPWRSFKVTFVGTPAT
jgi:hypothetical protein